MSWLVDGFAVSGYGGLSSAVPPVSPTPFWWANVTGGVAGAAIKQYGLDTFVPAGSAGADVFPFFAAQGAGSLLVSEPFDASGTDTVNLQFAAVTNRAEQTDTIVFAALVRDGAAVALLGAVRPDGRNHLGDLAHPATVDYPPPSTGVTCNYSTRSNPVTFALGGTTYGQPTLAGDCYGQCFTDVDCRFTPAAGRYQVVIGVLKGTDDGIGAVIVTNVTGGGTPAPPTNLHITS